MAKEQDSKDVQEQRKNNTKQLGGVTGKGFLPGQSGNPGGRPKGSVKLSTAYQRLLGQVMPDDPQGRTYAEVIAEQTCKDAANGNVRAAREIADRTEGRAKQTVTLNDGRAETEAAKYERKIETLMKKAEGRGTPIDRLKAIHLIAASDPRILEVFEITPASDSTQ